MIYIIPEHRILDSFRNHIEYYIPSKKITLSSWSNSRHDFSLHCSDLSFLLETLLLLKWVTHYFMRRGHFDSKLFHYFFGFLEIQKMSSFLPVDLHVYLTESRKVFKIYSMLVDSLLPKAAN